MYKNEERIIYDIVSKKDRCFWDSRTSVEKRVLSIFSHFRCGWGGSGIVIWFAVSRSVCGCWLLVAKGLVCGVYFFFLIHVFFFFGFVEAIKKISKTNCRPPWGSDPRPQG